MSDLSQNAHQTGRPPTTLNFAPPFIIQPGVAAGDPIAGSRVKTRQHPAFSRAQDQF